MYRWCKKFVGPLYVCLGLQYMQHFQCSDFLCSMMIKIERDKMNANWTSTTPNNWDKLKYNIVRISMCVCVHFYIITYVFSLHSAYKSNAFSKHFKHQLWYWLQVYSNERLGNEQRKTEFSICLICTGTLTHTLPVYRSNIFA